MGADGTIASAVREASWVPVAASRRSWIDWLRHQLDRIPAPRLLVWVSVAMAIGLVDHAVRWQDGSLPRFELRPLFLLEGSFLPLFLFAMRELDAVAQRAFQRIRPALPPLDGPELEAVGHELTRTPGAWAFAAALASPIFAVASVTNEPSSYGLRSDSPAATWALAIILSALSAFGGLVFAAHAIGQLRMVTRIHRAVTVDLFRLQPLYAFSTLTSLTGISLVAIMLFGLLFLYTFASLTAFAATDLLMLAALASLAVACFVVPLLGLHGRIDSEKGRRLSEAQATLERALAEVQAKIGTGDFERAKDLNDGLSAARGAVATIAAVSTWPWRPETLRGFLSALVVPVVLWLTTAFLAQAIGR
jgi:hypothetical protein